ncbi:hypothetical protein AVEN_185847-1 [Araneus ventricosus]|uniref:Uncharacterized protein n=1 Tax=Araneus ventricosus TaxID=182803 RepID=A0A4Y2JKW3_ARAVE|nr:hypothetical protein AVEN_185847-1 [Araneus ventricosus]
MFSIEDCIIQLATPFSTPGPRFSALSTTNCEEKKGECGRVHFTNPYVNKTSVYKGSKILRAARSQRVKVLVRKVLRKSVLQLSMVALTINQIFQKGKASIVDEKRKHCGQPHG